MRRYDCEPEREFLAFAPGLDGRQGKLGRAESGNQQADAGHCQAHDARSDAGELIRARNQARDPQAVDAVGHQHPDDEQQTQYECMADAAELRRRSARTAPTG